MSINSLSTSGLKFCCGFWNLEWLGILLHPLYAMQVLSNLITLGGVGRGELTYEREGDARRLA